MIGSNHQPDFWPEWFRLTGVAFQADRYKSFDNLQLVGRNGMHKYNNQDHAMMTAMLCVENIVADSRLYDLWQVNQDAEYHEAGSAGDAPAEISTPAPPQHVGAA